MCVSELWESGFCRSVAKIKDIENAVVLNNELLSLKKLQRLLGLYKQFCIMPVYVCRLCVEMWVINKVHSLENHDLN